jgi:Raf kinase inhibitor-like YbhB/YbcL family protein
MMKLTSPLFLNNNGFPEKYTCDGEEVNPPLDIEGVPEGTVSLALVLRDPDAVEGMFIHWILWNFGPKTTEIKAGYLPDGAMLGKTTDGKIGYVGPCPPSGSHRYTFTLYALDTELYINEGVSIGRLEAAMEGHILEQADLMAKYR